MCLLVIGCQRDNSPEVMRDMCRRLIPQHADRFVFELVQTAPQDDSRGTDFYTVESRNGKIVISGNSTGSLAVGLNRYLTECCKTRVSWYASEKVHMPETLPVLKEKITGESVCKDRFFLNYCTFGYTMPYWKWADWERLIDWMALNGVNMPLAITGQESVWYRVWTGLGLTDEEVRNYFTGPAHLPWHRMTNVDHWQGPLPMSWLEDQEKLQCSILERERAFGMTPILPAFAGHVPAELSRLYPEAKITVMSKWGGFDDEYRSHFLDPEDSLYVEVQHRFLEEQSKLYGTDHIYGIDPFNEVDSPDWGEEYLSRVAKKIYQSLADADPDAHWVQMTWMFYHSAEKWTPERIRAFFSAVPDGKLTLLDYYCDYTELWKKTENYYGKPYIWCYLGNFGGNSFLAGDLDDTYAKIKGVMADGGENFAGLGATLEALDVNPLMYEFVFRQAWNTDGDTSDSGISEEENLACPVEDWVENWAECRGGNEDSHIVEAWKELYAKVYTETALCGQAVLINARPQLEGVQGWNTHPEYHYDNADLFHIWSLLFEAHEVDNDLYRFDVVNIGRQVLGNLFLDYRASFAEAYRLGDLELAEDMAERMDELIVDSDRLLSTNLELNMGKWVRDARDFGRTDEEKDYYEKNARTLVTVWGQENTQINDYANRGWGGLTGSFYRKRWKMFTDDVLEAMRACRPFRQEDFQKKVIRFEADWTSLHEDFPLVSGEDPVAVARELSDKYEKAILPA